jgi:adenylosuccinate lyase
VNENDSTGLHHETAFRNPLVDRYASAEMSRIFSPAYKFTTWRKLWLALAESQRELGLPITAEAVEQMRANIETVDLRRADELERKVRHDVMAHVHHYGEVAPAAAGVIHLGATSAYVTDNTELLQQRDGLLLLRRKLISCIRSLATFARRHRAFPTLGYTHFQPAQPTTVGKRATLWLQDLVLDVEEVDHRLKTFRFRGIRGTTGTEASFLELFQGDHAKVAELNRRVTQKMGLDKLYGVTGQTYTRKTDYSVLACLAGIAASTSKFANDIRLLQHLKEIEEPFEKDQIGSSAMAYKRNPMRSERISALSRHVITLSLDPAFTAASQWLERTLDDSANRRIAIPESFLGTDAILLLMHNIANGLVVRRAVILQHLEEELPFMATEAILMRAVRNGRDRQTVHERIRRHSIAAAEQVKEHGAKNDLIERLSDDPEIGLSEVDIVETLDPVKHVGRAPEQVDEFLAAEVEPLLRGPSSREGVPELRA